MGADPSHHTNIFHLPGGQETGGTQRVPGAGIPASSLVTMTGSHLLGQTSATASVLLGLGSQRVGLDCRDSI